MKRTIDCPVASDESGEAGEALDSGVCHPNTVNYHFRPVNRAKIMPPFVRLCCSTAIIATLSASVHAQTMTSLFDFAQSSDTAEWQIVNDGVMGGRSSSQASIVSVDAGGGSSGETNVMRFTGNLSLANNGGFASVRSRPNGSLGLDPGETIVLRVKGDGRRYTFNLYTPNRRTAFSYQLEFATKAGQWTEVNLPIDNFVAHSFGRRMPNMNLMPTQVESIGILLGDKQPGTFEILIDSIMVR